jgi:hypothetical protein
MDHEVMWRKCPARRNWTKAWEERQNRTRQPLARKKPLLSCYDSSPDVFGSFLLLPPSPSWGRLEAVARPIWQPANSAFDPIF